MDVVEIYEPETETWETGPSLCHPRRGRAVVSTPDGRIYAIGGTSGHSVFHPLRLLGDEDRQLKLGFRQCPITQNSVKERIRPRGGTVR